MRAPPLAPVPALALALALTLALTLGAGPAAARDCYRAANAAYGAERFDEAGRLFSESADDPACAASKVRLLISAGEAFRRGAERSGDAQGYCRASDAYQRAAKLADRKRLADIATAGAEATTVHCPAPEPPAPSFVPAPVTPAPPPAAEPEPAPPTAAPPEPAAPAEDDSSTPWIIAGVAAGAAVVGVGVAWLVLGSDEAPKTKNVMRFNAAD
ncbi:MAG: hypothetical protein R3F65_19435 [bacterium]